MNGTVIPQTPIAVDFWQLRKCPWVKFFFLSHLHSDHTKGLTSSWMQPIYCSPLTGKLLVHTLQIQASLVRPLEVNTSHIIALDDLSEEKMVVTVIDANHCPGSVMFLFEGYFGTILYTGDFRYEMLSGSVLLDLLQPKTVDVLYVDNTYCDPSCQFPPRSESKQQIINIITQHPDHNVIIALRNLGKEQLLVDLAMHFETWIVISKTQLEKLKILELPNVFTTNPNTGFIRVEPFHQLSAKKIRSWNNDGRTLVILPTSLFTGLNMQPYGNCPDTHVVPYSDHSSYSELHAFVHAIAPRQVKPIVLGSSRGVFGTCVQNRADMSCFNKYLNSDRQTPITVPLCIRKLMQSVSINKTGTWKRKAKPLFLHVKRHQHHRGITFEDNLDQDSTSHESSSSGEDKPTTIGDAENDSCESGMSVVESEEPVSFSPDLNLATINGSDKVNESDIHDCCVSLRDMGDEECHCQDRDNEVLPTSDHFVRMTSTAERNRYSGGHHARGILAGNTGINMTPTGNTDCNTSPPGYTSIELITPSYQRNANTAFLHKRDGNIGASTESHFMCQTITDTEYKAASNKAVITDISNIYEKETVSAASHASTNKNASSVMTSADGAVVVTSTDEVTFDKIMTMAITSVRCSQADCSSGLSSKYLSVATLDKTCQRHISGTGERLLCPDDNTETSRQIRASVISHKTLSSMCTESYPRTTSVISSPGSGHIHRPLTEIQEVITSTPKETVSRFHKDIIRHLPRTPQWQLDQENLIIEQEIKKQ